jgi:hypothetical protein
MAEAQLKDAAAAQPDDAQLQGAMHQARAMLLVAKGDAVRADALKLYGRKAASLITRARFGTPAKAS